MAEQTKAPRSRPKGLQVRQLSPKDSEWNVSVRWHRRRLDCGCIRPCRRRSAEKLYAVRHDLRSMSFPAVVVRLELARLQAAFDVNLPPFLQILFALIPSALHPRLQFLDGRLY